MTLSQTFDQTPLSEDELEQLENFLFSEAVSEEALDYLGIHGLLTALAVGPVEVPTQEWLEVVFDGTPGYRDEAQQAQVHQWLVREHGAICQELNSEEVPELPCDLSLDDEDESLLVWSQGFMEGVFLRESDWFSHDEEQVAQMLLPIMLVSELFDEPELVEMRKDPKLCAQLCAEIPELIVDLYLHFRVPEEKKSAAGGKPAPRKR